MSAPPVKFTKMSAGGNDFLVIDNITAPDADAVPIDSAFVRRCCARALSVGADGLIVIEPAEKAHVRMIYFNADGGRAALCGNGVRCVVRLAAVKRIAPAEAMVIETDVGLLRAGFSGDTSWFSLPLGRPVVVSRTLDLEGSLDEVSRSFETTHVVAGVPHLIIENPDAHRMKRDEFLSLASRLRSHPDLGPEGANVDFVTLRDEGALDIRCYERGVEAETLSSGSGCIASAIAMTRAGRARTPVTCRSRAGFLSMVTLSEDADGQVEATLSGDARIIYTAVLHEEALSGFVV